MKYNKNLAKILLFLIFIIFSSALISKLYPAFFKKTKVAIKLSEDEVKWLKTHKTLRLAPDPEFQPIEFIDSNGEYMGLAADYANLLKKKIGINFEIIRCKNWNDVIEKIKRHEVDILNAVVKTPQREAFLKFTKPYLKLPSVIIVRTKANKLLTLKMLKGMNIVMVSGYGYVDLIRIKYPELKIELVNDLKTALRKVSFGMSDAFVGDLSTASYYIESEGITNLKLAGEVEPSNISGFAVRSDYKILCGILEKGMALITEDEKESIFNKWIHLSLEQGLTMKKFQKLMFIITLIVLIIIFMFIFFNRKLQTIIKSKAEDLRKEIDNRTHIQIALKETEVRMHTLLKAIPDLVWLKDLNGTFLACNAKFEQLLNKKEEEIIGKTDFDFFPKEIADSFRYHDKIALSNGVPTINEEEVIYANDGHHEFVETIKTPMFDSNNNIIGVLGIAHNITERKLAEQERKKMDAKLRQSHKMEAIGTLAGGIAHDFNNILAAIIGYSEIALDDLPVSSPAWKYLTQILNAGNRAKELVKQILYFSRKEDFERKPTQINVLVLEAIKLLRATIPATIEIKESIDSNCGNILANPTQIHQVLINLCTNAAHSMEEFGGVMEIIVKPTTLNAKDLEKEQNLKPGNYVKISIKDSGIGIDKKILDKIFDPYFTTKKVGKGSGMGLAVVHGIVKSHDAMITVESKLGKGTTFNVYFPNIEDKIQEENKYTETLATGKENILVVDDEEILTNMVKLMGESLGYHVTTKNSSLEALDLFRSQPNSFDIVISDQTMPELTGDKLAEKFMEIRPDIPIIICSGYCPTFDAEKAKLIGVKAFLMKPINKKELANLIRYILDNKYL